MIEQTTQRKKYNAGSASFRRNVPKEFSPEKRLFINNHLPLMITNVYQMTKIFEKLGKSRPSHLADNILSIFDR